MMIPLSLAEKLQLLAIGEQLQAGRLKHIIVDEMIAEGIIIQRLSGRTKSTLYVADAAAFSNYLYNKYAIASLQEYIAVVKDLASSRADLIQVSTDSKTASRRTFKGFLINSYEPVACMLNGRPLTIRPAAGTFSFIHDHEGFIPAADVVIAGMENAESFSRAHLLQYLLPGLKVLFVCRYPQEQGKDLMKWLLSIPNAYLHMGDYDFAGINIYMQEYKKQLLSRASFFIPANIDQLLQQYGNRNLYDRQQLNNTLIDDAAIEQLIALIHKHKKGLEQEVLLIADTGVNKKQQ